MLVREADGQLVAAPTDVTNLTDALYYRLRSVADARAARGGSRPLTQEEATLPDGDDPASPRRVVRASLRYRVTDGEGGSAELELTIHVHVCQPGHRIVYSDDAEAAVAAATHEQGGWACVMCEAGTFSAGLRLPAEQCERCVLPLGASTPGSSECNSTFGWAVITSCVVAGIILLAIIAACVARRLAALEVAAKAAENRKLEEALKAANSFACASPTASAHPADTFTAPSIGHFYSRFHSHFHSHLHGRFHSHLHGRFHSHLHSPLHTHQHSCLSTSAPAHSRTRQVPDGATRPSRLHRPGQPAAA